MASSLKFDGLQEYATTDPVRLRSELQRQNQKVREALMRAELLFEPLPKTTLVAGGEYNASFFEAVMVDCTNTSGVVALPPITSADEGKYVEVGRSSANNTVTARAAAGQLVQGVSQDSIASIGCQRYRVIRGAWWRLV